MKRAILFFIIGFLMATVVGLTMEPVTVQGARFYSAGQPYFPATHFLAYLATSSHIYFSHKTTDANRLKTMSDLHAGGYNSAYIMLLSQDGKDTTPYLDTKRFIGGAFDDARILQWRAWLEDMIAQGVRPVLWLFCDDSPKIKKAPVDELKRYIQRMTTAFDDLPVLWILALEVDEYWSQAQSDDLGSYLKLLTANPVGVHQRPGRTDYMQSHWVDFGAYQHGFAGDWTTVYDAAISAQQAIGDRPLLFAEYQKGASFTANQKGLAAAFGGSAGVGNGAPAGLAEFMAGLPDGMVPSRVGNVLILSGSGVESYADMTTLEFTVE